MAKEDHLAIMSWMALRMASRTSRGLTLAVAAMSGRSDSPAQRCEEEDMHSSKTCISRRPSSISSMY